MTRKYIIGSGWYCTPGRVYPNGGNRYSRTTQFHELWKQCIFRYSKPSEVVIVDSCSPILPPVDVREKWISLDDNYQCKDHLLSGWGRSFILTATYAYCCMADLIYVEQDCLAIGDWVEECYQVSDKHPSSFLAGRPYRGASHTLEMSFVFVPRRILLDLVKAFPNGPCDKGRDESQLGRCGVPFEFLPFGTGRNRPFDLKATSLQVQHWTDPEVKEAAQFLGLSDQVERDYANPDSWGG